jgi:hypothetical protein
MLRIFVKKGFLFKAGSVCRVQLFKTGSRNCHIGEEDFADDEEVETEVQKWQRQQLNTSMLRVSTHW